MGTSKYRRIGSVIFVSLSQKADSNVKYNVQIFSENRIDDNCGFNYIEMLSL
jgi:hypothetical protein